MLKILHNFGLLKTRPMRLYRFLNLALTCTYLFATVGFAPTWLQTESQTATGLQACCCVGSCACGEACPGEHQKGPSVQRVKAGATLKSCVSNGTMPTKKIGLQKHLIPSVNLGFPALDHQNGLEPLTGQTQWQPDPREKVPIST